MVDREHGHDHDALRDLHIKAGRILRHISVGQHDALALSCGSGCKHDRTELIRLRHIVEASPVLFQKLPEGVCMVVMCFLLHGYHDLQLRTAVLRDCRHILSDLVIDEHRRIRTGDQIAHLFCRKVHIQGHNDAPAVDCAKISHKPRIGGHPDDSDVFPLLSHVPEHVGKAFAVLF